MLDFELVSCDQGDRWFPWNYGRKAREDLPDGDAGFTVFVQAEASAWLLWRSWPRVSEELVSLDRGLLFPERADEWAIDSGEVFEPGFSDSAFAEDRRFGYALSAWCDAWGPDADPFDALPADAPDEDYEAAEAALALQSCFDAGSVDGWIIDSEAMCAYASVRRFLRTLTWHDYDDVNELHRSCSSAIS